MLPTIRDIAPTVASTAGFNEPLYMGHDLALVAAGRHPGRAFVFSEHVDNSFRAVRDRRFIWIERPRESLEPSGFPIEEERLFLRDGTPAAGSFQAEAERLRGAVVSLMGSRPEVQNAWQPGPPIDDATVNHLIRLGYLQPPGPKAGQVRSR